MDHRRKLVSIFLTICMIVTLLPAAAIPARAAEATLDDLFSTDEAGNYLINSADDWNALADYVAEDPSHDCAGKTFLLTGNIGSLEEPITEPIGRQIGTGKTNDEKEKNRMRFAGTFDGGGNTIYVVLNSTDNAWFSFNRGYCSPFAYTMAATIRNLHVDGSITTKGQWASGLIGSGGGHSTVENCHISASIISNYVNSGSNYANHGGVVAIAEGGATISDTWFDGSFQGSNYAYSAGFVGMNKTDTTVLTNCLFAPELVTAKDVTHSAEFVLNQVNKSFDYVLDGCYYLTGFGEKPQGTPVYESYGQGDEVTSVTFGGKTYYVISGNSAWAALQGALKTESFVQLTGSVTAGAMDTALVIEAGQDVTLDLNGCTIHRNLPEETAKEAGYVILVEAGASLTVIDSSDEKTGTITGGNNVGNGGGICCEGVLTMEGGTVTGNRAHGHGGGVYVKSDAGETCSFSNCSISGNYTIIGENNNIKEREGGGLYLDVAGAVSLESCTINGNVAKNAGGGIYIAGGEVTAVNCQINENNSYAFSNGAGIYLADGSLTLNGGIITGNTGTKSNKANLGVGVYVAGGELAVQGKVTVLDNLDVHLKSNITQQNVYLPGGAITVAGDITGSAIGVSTADGTGIFTDGLAGKGDAKCFTSDVPDYGVRLDADGEAELKPLYTITVDEEIKNGTVSAQDTATEGEEVSVTVKADNYFVTGTVRYDDGEILPEDGAYALTMPAKNVTITATFRKTLSHGDVTIKVGEDNPHTGKKVLPKVTVEDGKYTLLEGTDYEVALADGDEGVAVGNHNIVVTGLGDYAGTATLPYKITKADPSKEIKAPAAVEKLTFNGESQVLVKVGTSPAGTTMQYSLGTDKTPSGNWSDAVPTGRDAGDYFVWYRVDGGNDYSDCQGKEPVKVSVAKSAAPKVEDVRVTLNKDTTTVNASVVGLLPADAGTLTYKAESEERKGDSVTVSKFSVSADGAVTAEVTGGKEGDQVTLPVTIRSTNYADVKVGVVVTLSGKYSATVTITNAVSHVKAGGLSKTYGDDAVDLAAEVETKGSKEGKWSWSSSNASVATVVDGTVTILGQGETAITAAFESKDASGQTTILLKVAPKPVTLAGLTVSQKVYDGKAAVELTGTAAVDGLLEGDDVSLTEGKAAFADADAGTGKAVTFTGYALTGKDAGNYSLSLPTKLTADITPAPVTVTVTATSRDYAVGKTEVKLVAGAVKGAVGDDDVTVDVSGAKGTMADENVGKDKAVTVEGVKLGGKAAKNYSLSAQPGNVTVTIFKIDHPEVEPIAATVWSGQVTTDKTLDLGELPLGASYADVSVKDKAPLVSACSVSGTTLTFSTTSQKARTTATITLQVTGAVNYNDYTVTVEVTAKDKANANATIDGGDRSVEYGDDPTLTATVKKAGEGTGTWTWRSDNILVAEVDGAGKITTKKTGSTTIYAKYESDTTAGEASIKLTVKEKKITAATVSVAGTYTYNGSAQIPADDNVTVTLPGGKALVKGTDYTVKLSDNVNAGTATVTVTGTGNCSGTAQGTFTIDSASLTILATDQTINVREDLPPMEYTVEGLVEGDALITPPTLNYNETPDTTKAGTYVITPADADAGKNYAITYVTAVLTIVDNTQPATEAYTPGVTTRTVLHPDGTKTVVTTAEDGSSASVTTDAQGNVIAQGAQVSQKAAESGTVVALHLETTVAASAQEAMPITITVPGGAVAVEIPVKDLTAGTVALLVKEDGTQEIIKTSTTSASGVVVTLSGTTTVKIVDNGKTFDDVPEGKWYSGDVAWAASREVVPGSTEDKFEPDAETSLSQVAQIFLDLAGDESVLAALEEGLALADEDGMLREQVALMLYNYARYKGYDVTLADDALFLSFDDVQDVSEWALAAVRWGVETGLIRGTGDGKLSPQETATKAQVAALLHRFCELVEN